MPSVPHYISALIYMLAATACCYWAYREYKKQNFQHSALLLAVAAFALRFFMASDLFLHEWDERYHALVAKNLWNNFLAPQLYTNPVLPYDYKSWTSNYIWLHKQPLPLWCMAAGSKIFGINEIAVRLPSVIISSIAVYFTYYIGKKFFDERTGLLAAFFHAINGLVMDVTTGRAATDHIDIFFLFFIEFAIFIIVVNFKKQKFWLNLLTGVSIGLAVLCKWLPAFIVLPVWLILNYKKQSAVQLVWGALTIVVIACVVFLPWQIYMYCKFPLEYTHEMLYNYRHIVEALDEKEGGIFYFFGKIHININEFFWGAFIWFCYQFYKRDNFINRLALLVWVLIPFVFFTAVQTKMQAYLLFVFPALFIMLANFSLFLLQPIKNTARFKIQKFVFALIIFLAVRFSVERIKPFQNQTAQLSWANEFRQMGQNNGNKKVYLNVKHNIEGMFYTNSIMYNYMPYPNEIEGLKAKGYEVIINENPDL